MKQFRKSILFLTIFFAATANVSAQNPDSLLLKNFRPKSIYKIPVTRVEKAKFPVIDMHSHPYANSKEEILQWLKVMDGKGIEKTIILTYSTGTTFDSLYKMYSAFGKRFEVWCGFDYTGYNEPGWSEKAIKELVRCFKAGARGVGEMGDKGLGELYSKPVAGVGMHIDDPRMKPLLQKCAELNMPISIHVAEPMWMYEPMDSTNDGLMNAYTWRVDKSKPNLLGHEQLVQTLENAVRDNPSTIFVACHLANCEYDLSILTRLLKKYKNLYADIAARYAETATIPRYMLTFFEQNQDQIVYGTDMGFDPSMYEMTFRILETKDEHFYEIERTGYHWSLNGFGLPDKILKKLYSGNAVKILTK
jgi:predicted TIM-barrel fold metal-dependent hydrolase